MPRSISLSLGGYGKKIRYSTGKLFAVVKSFMKVAAVLLLGRFHVEI